MSASKTATKLCLMAVAHTLLSHSAAEAQHKPLSRLFVAGPEERYVVSVSLKAQTQIVSTEAVEPVARLPEPPEFSSNLTIFVTIERFR